MTNSKQIAGAPSCLARLAPPIMIPGDVATFTAHRSPPSEQEEALALLQSATMHDGSVPGPRLLRCALIASGGSLDRLRMEIESLKRDYRDVIVEGEYVPMGANC